MVYTQPVGILAHRTSEDEEGVYMYTETKRKVFRFHETILSFGDWIPRDWYLRKYAAKIDHKYSCKISGNWWSIVIELSIHFYAQISFKKRMDQ